METNGYKNCSKIVLLHSPRILFLFSQVHLFFVGEGLFFKTKSFALILLMFLLKKNGKSANGVLIRYLFFTQLYPDSCKLRIITKKAFWQGFIFCRNKK